MTKSQNQLLRRASRQRGSESASRIGDGADLKLEVSRLQSKIQMLNQQLKSSQESEDKIAKLR